MYVQAARAESAAPMGNIFVDVEITSRHRRRRGLWNGLACRPCFLYLFSSYTLAAALNAVCNFDKKCVRHLRQLLQKKNTHAEFYWYNIMQWRSVTIDVKEALTLRGGRELRKLENISLISYNSMIIIFIQLLFVYRYKKN